MIKTLTNLFKQDKETVMAEYCFLTPVWNGALVLCRGALTSAGILILGLYPNLQAASMAHNGLRTEDNGRTDLPNQFPA